MLFSVVALASLSIFTTLTSAIDVTVGPDNAFHPNEVYGNPGELVNFHFAGSGLSASEATARLSDPCNTEGGFDSGIEHSGATFSIVISTHNSIYVFSQNQCTQGFVMIVNPGPSDSVAQYQKVASNGAVQNQSPSSAAQSSKAAKATSTTRDSPAITSTVAGTTSTPESNSYAMISSTSSMTLLPASTSSSAAPSTSIASSSSALNPVATPASASTDGSSRSHGNAIILLLLILGLAVPMLYF